MGTPNQKGTVEFIKQDCIDRGVIPVPQSTNCHSAEITIRVAWATRAQGAMLILKQPSQNGCQMPGHPKVSHDAINYPDGYVDCLVSAGPPDNLNTPAWDWTPGTHSPTDADAVPPWDLDAGVVPPDPVPPTPIEPMPPMPTEWSSAAIGEMLWWTDMCPRLDAVYCNLLTKPGQPLRHADYGGWGNWVQHIREEAWTVDQVVAGIKTSDEYKAAHPEG